MKLYLCKGHRGATQLLLATAVRSLLVFLPRFILTAVTAAVEKKHNAVKMLMCSSYQNKASIMFLSSPFLFF